MGGKNSIILNKFQIIKSKYIVKEILECLEHKKILELIKYNKNIQKRLDIGINNYYQEYSKKIIIEIIPKENTYGEFINIAETDSLCHIYFNDDYETEINYNSIDKDDEVKKKKS